MTDSLIIRENAKRTVIYAGQDSDSNWDIAYDNNPSGIPTLPAQGDSEADYVMRVPSSSSNDEPSWRLASSMPVLQRNRILNSSQIASGNGGTDYYTFSIDSSDEAFNYFRVGSPSYRLILQDAQPTTMPLYWFELVRSSDDNVFASGWMPHMGAPNGTGSGTVFEVYARYEIYNDKYFELMMGRSSDEALPYYWAFRQVGSFNNATEVYLYAVPLIP